MKPLHSSTEISYEQYIEGTLIPGIREMQTRDLAFLSFVIIGSSIEALGSFFDKLPMDADSCSKRRFKAAMDKLFKPIHQGYEQGCNCRKNLHNNYCLYKGLRCGMAHIGHPQGKIAFTTRHEAQIDKTSHLGRDAQGILVLVAEDLSDHFEAAWKKLKQLSAARMTEKKITQPFIRVTTYENP